MAECVHATAAGPAGHLLELVRDEHPSPPAVPLAHPADHDRASGHVDAQGERVGGEDHLHQPPREEHLDQLLEQRQQPGVVETDPFLGEGGDQANLLEFAILGAQAAEQILDDGVDLLDLLQTNEIRTHHGQPLGKCLAVVAAKQKVDDREHVLGRQRVHDLARLRLVDLGSATFGGATPASVSTLATQFSPDRGEVVDLGAVVIDDEVHLIIEEVVERQGHGPLGMGNEPDRAMGAADPGRDLVGVGDGGGEADELDVLRAEDDGLFPGGSPLLIGQVVDLVEDDAVDIVQIPGGLEQHVPQDLGRHDDDAGVAVLGHVAGEQSHLITMELTQVTELLVGQRLDRGRVEDPPGALERLINSEFRHDSFAGTCRSGDHDGIVPEKCPDRLPLELIEGKRVVDRELVDLGFDRRIETGSQPLELLGGAFSPRRGRRFERDRLSGRGLLFKGNVFRGG